MEDSIDAMSDAYDALVDAVAAAVREPAGDRGRRGAAAALGELKQRLDTFAASCDRAEDLVRAAERRVAAEAGAGDFASSLPPPCAAPAAGSRLELLLHAVQAIGGDVPACSGDMDGGDHDGDDGEEEAEEVVVVGEVEEVKDE